MHRHASYITASQNVYISPGFCRMKCQSSLLPICTTSSYGEHHTHSLAPLALAPYSPLTSSYSLSVQLSSILICHVLTPAILAASRDILWNQNAFSFLSDAAHNESS